jgi:hypothetical protein
MAMSQDETAVRDALQDLTTGQPDQPVDRLAGIHRRHVRRRSLQAVGAVAAVALAVSGTLLGVGAIGGTSGQQSPISPDDANIHEEHAGWQLPWPMRTNVDTPDDEIDRIQASALAAFESSQGVSLSDVRDAHLLYAGRPDGMDVTWVVFEAAWGPPQTLAVPHLVGMASPTGDGDWTPYVESAPPPDTTDIGFAWQDSAQVFALGSPEVASPGLVDLSSGDTVLVADDPPYIVGAAFLRLDHPLAPQTLYIGQRDFSTTYPVFFPEGAEDGQGLPEWQQANPESQGTVHNIGSFAGTGPSGRTEMSVSDDGDLGFVVRCAGPAPMTVVLDDGERSTRAVQRRCDGVDASVGAGTTVHRGDQVTVSVEVDAATSFVIAAYVNTDPPEPVSCEEIFADTASSQQEGYCSSPQGPVQIYATSCPNGRWLISAEYEGGEDAAWAYEGDPWKRIGRDGSDRYQTEFFDCTGEGSSPSS